MYTHTHETERKKEKRKQLSSTFVDREAPARKTDVLKLDMSGRFAINVVDSLVMVHHQASKVTIHFDADTSARFSHLSVSL